MTGAAGGDRNTTARRTALSGLAAALRDLPSVADPASAAPVRIRTTSPELAEFAGFLAGLAEPTQLIAPEEDLDLWAQIVTAAKGRRLELSYAPPAAGTPGGFASAWADLAFDKAKAKGLFASAIPKPNLAKIPGLDG